MIDQAMKQHCWEQSCHVSNYDRTLKLGTSALVKLFDSYNDVQLLRKTLARKTAQQRQLRLVEIGCATGELYRYLRHTFPDVEYIGADISHTALARAREKFPDAHFHTIGSGIEELKAYQPNIVFCRDVMLHQDDPMEFFRMVLVLRSDTLVLRTRSKDVGATEWDKEKSCQKYGNKWAPYIVINIRDIIQEIKKTAIGCRSITIVKDYEILGGRNDRYLPKDCYFSETGTANVSMCLEFESGLYEQEPQIIVSQRQERAPLIISVIFDKVVNAMQRILKTKIMTSHP